MKSTGIMPVITHLAYNKCGLDNIHAGHILQVTSCFQPDSCAHLHKHPSSVIQVQTQASNSTYANCWIVVLANSMYSVQYSAYITIVLGPQAAMFVCSSSVCQRAAKGQLYVTGAVPLLNKTVLVFCPITLSGHICFICTLLAVVMVHYIHSLLW